MTSSCYHLKRSTNAVNKVRMHIITVSVTVFFLIKIQLLMILKKGLLSELEREEKSSQKCNIFWVGPVLGG